MSLIKKTLLVMILMFTVFALFAKSEKALELNVNPNPMKEVTTISFDLSESQHVNLVITDTKGIVLKTIYSDLLAKGYHQFNWDGTDYSNSRLPEGKYIVELSYGAKFTSVKKIIILK